LVDIEVGGTALRLLPQRAAYVPAARPLLVADVHVGKAVSFRRLGVPVPSGTTAATLAALSALIDGTGAARVVFLGDLLHAARSRTAATVAAVRDWRARHAGVELTLVRGNHDRRAGDPPREWNIDVVDAPLRLAQAGALALAHHPAPVPGAYVLAGHVHPAAIVGGRGERLRLPCFHFGAEVGVLPAFGHFTGMHVLPRAPGDRVWVVAGDEVRALNSAA
jgi:DNA ligase-associated metallophosphoesterase